VSAVTESTMWETAEEPAVEQSRSRWERWLLALELGGLGTTPGGAGSDVPRARSARDWVVDGVLFAYALTAAASTAVNDRLEGPTSLLVLNCAFGGVASVSLWARKRHPLGVAWLAVVVAAVSSAAVHAAEVAIFSAAIHARPPRGPGDDRRHRGDGDRLHDLHRPPRARRLQRQLLRLLDGEHGRRAGLRILHPRPAGAGRLAAGARPSPAL